MKSDLPGLDQLIKDIFDIIPAYYDDYTANKIKKMINDYLMSLEERR